jgi:hypothetical protein
VSTGRQPTGQLAPWNMPLSLEPQHDSPPCASQEEEPFEIELVVPGGPVAQGAPVEGSSSRRTTTSTMKMKMMKSTLP